MDPSPSAPKRNRSVVFVDGANLYNNIKAAGVRAKEVDIEKVAAKIVKGRPVLQIRYYIPEIDRSAGRAYTANQDLIADLRVRRLVHISLGYIQRSFEDNPCAQELLRYLGSLRSRLPAQVYRDLVQIGQRHSKVAVFHEKGIDVALAIDLVSMARSDEYDVAYLLSADGDFCPAVQMARELGKRVFAASPVVGARLKSVCNASIRLDRSWFKDCMK